MRRISFPPDFRGWQAAARQLLGEAVEPHLIDWEELNTDQPGLEFSSAEHPQWHEAQREFRVPRKYLQLARSVACHRDSQRWALLYRVLWRLTHGEPML